MDARSVTLENPRSGRQSVRYVRRFPVGAELAPGGGAHFRVWAPRSQQVAVQLGPVGDAVWKQRQPVALASEGGGYFAGFVPEARAGWVYQLKLDSGLFPDPASRFQPEGPHGPSQLVDPAAFAWTDGDWRGVTRTGQVLYELHLGTFTPEGTWAAAAARLPQLAELGITVVEVMPVADFPGRFGWGYDGVALFAPTRLYGTPDEFRAFVDRAHQLGLGVILDVVYNHLGPDGNYLKHFSEDYFTDRYANEWGEALNFDGEESGPVREFFVTNAVYWIAEYHIDGLRLDATQQIFDASPKHLLAELTEATRHAAGQRSVYLVAENEAQHSRLARTPAAAGFGLDALWNDDFHHSARVALTGHSEAYYSDYRGAPQEFISALKRGYLYQGQWYAWQKKCRGTPTTDVAPEQFITYLQNHDQIANSLRGLRLEQLSSPGRYRALSALLLLAPATPMLFQGQEFGATAPFLFFADHNPELAPLVARGRRQFLHQFPSVADTASQDFVPLPHAPETFARCKLDWSERERHGDALRFHRDLLRLRRDDAVFAGPGRGGLDGAVLGSTAFVLRFFGEQGNDRLLLVNLGRDLRLSPVPEPLLAPPEGRSWKLKWSSEDPGYGGTGTPAVETNANWVLPGEAALVLEAAWTT